MDLTKLEELSKRGQWEAAWKLFERMLRDEVYQAHGVGKEVSHLVHYTSLDALISMLGVSTVDGEAYVLGGSAGGRKSDDGARRGYLRVYDTFSANDPNEGKYFVDSADADESFQGKYKAVWELFKERSKSPAYQTSLRQVSKPEDADDLTFWRTYGGGGRGCALVFPAKRLRGLDKLYTVRYGVEEAQACVGRIAEALDRFISLEIPAAADFDGSRRVPLPASFASLLSSLVYLYKSDDYKDEREARVVVPFADLAQGALLERAAGNRGWRHFAQLPELKIEELLGTGCKIVLGPSAELSPNLRFVLRNLLQKRGFDDSGVRKSRISYRA